MRLGVYLRELWGHKLGLALSLLIALAASLQIVCGISLLPPGVGGGSLGLGSASTHVIVDTPRSAVVAPETDAYTLESLSNRALILGNVVASLPVRRQIARRVGVPVEAIRVEPPLTPDQPRAMADSAHAPHVSDILRRPDEYRLSVEANPMAPVLDVYAVAPSAGEATELAEASVDGLREYVASVAARERTPAVYRVRLEQLGRARGGAVSSGADIQIGALAFLLVFAACCAVVLFLARVGQGWRAAAGGPALREVG